MPKNTSKTSSKSKKAAPKKKAASAKKAAPAKKATRKAARTSFAAPVAAASAPPANKTTGGGTPFALQFGFLTSDNKRKVEFGMLKAFGDNSKPFYVIVFSLSDQVNGQFQERVKVDVRVGDFLSDKAQAMIDQGLTLTQQEFLRGPITTRAKALPPNTPSDKKLSNLNNKLVDMTPMS